MATGDALRCGLLGRKLVHSYSPQIHRELGSYSYTLFEREENEVGEFLCSDLWDALNVTIPYKKTVVPFLDSLSQAARYTGSVNTITRDAEGNLCGDNTDVYGFTALVQKLGIPVTGKKALVLGSGGASAAICVALEALGANPVVISRTGVNHYGNLALHADARLIVNATPVGMYPNNGEAPLDLVSFPQCEAVLDAIYNPFRTKLLLQAEALDIPHADGLYMLVAQAKRSAELFTGVPIPDDKIAAIHRRLRVQQQNIILIGMPGCGKTTVAQQIGALSGRRVLDSDAEMEKAYGAPPSALLQQWGEVRFRAAETEILRELGKQSGAIIATGGGAVTREENYPLLHQNGVIVWLKRDLQALPVADRPLSQKIGVEALYAAREPLYRRFADFAVELDSGASAETILRKAAAFIETKTI